MSTPLNDDLGRVLAGELSREEFGEIHGEHDFEAILSLHDRLSKLSTIEVEVAPWYAVAPGLGADPGPKRRRSKKAVLVSIAAALVLIPAAAEAIEAVAPEAVRGTLIDAITDVLPWDNDRDPVDDPEPPATDRAPVEEERPDEDPRDTPTPERDQLRDQTSRTVPVDSTTQPTRRVTDSTEVIERQPDSDDRPLDRVPQTTDEPMATEEPTLSDRDSSRSDSDSSPPSVSPLTSRVDDRVGAVRSGTTTTTEPAPAVAVFTDRDR